MPRLVFIHPRTGEEHRMFDVDANEKAAIDQLLEAFKYLHMGEPDTTITVQTNKYGAYAIHMAD